MQDTQVDFKKVYVSLIALKENLPTDSNLDEKYAHLYNDLVNRLLNLGIDDIKGFEIPQSEIRRVFISGNYVTGEKSYSENRYIERSILLIKLDALLNFFTISTPENVIGFNNS